METVQMQREINLLLKARVRDIKHNISLISEHLMEKEMYERLLTEKERRIQELEQQLEECMKDLMQNCCKEILETAWRQ
jgi:hypothetical protein